MLGEDASALGSAPWSLSNDRLSWLTQNPLTETSFSRLNMPDLKKIVKYCSEQMVRLNRADLSRGLNPNYCRKAELVLLAADAYQKLQDARASPGPPIPYVTINRAAPPNRPMYAPPASAFSSVQALPRPSISLAPDSREGDLLKTLSHRQLVTMDFKRVRGPFAQFLSLLGQCYFRGGVGSAPEHIVFPFHRVDFLKLYASLGFCVTLCRSRQEHANGTLAVLLRLFNPRTHQLLPWNISYKISVNGMPLQIKPDVLGWNT